MISKFSKKVKIIIALALVLLVGLGCLGYYQYVFKKSPSYTIMLIGKSVKEHNVEEFNKHVDVKSIVGNYVKDRFENDPELASNPFARMFMPAITAVAQNAISERVNDMVAGKDISNDTEGKNNPIVKAFIDNTKNDGKMSLVSIEKLKTNEDGSAEVKLVLKNEEKNEEIPVLVMMKPLEDGTWNIYKINNVDELLNK